ncbi:unnamed protein product [Enterobius vermicularis]|uniref:Protein-tyrosine-phosphatase n=1 Tax=Enterobius vermicularis TaxID=51028 RepID=A0A0N4VKI2_ENTVE|nr:unnamed protein product [Enterobius vermicularis]
MPRISFTVNHEYARISELIPGLMICGVSELTLDNMLKHRVSHIVNATSEVPNFRFLGNIQRTKLWYDDTPQTYIFPDLDLVTDQIHSIIHDGGRVLVHCVAGVSRSATVCLAYLMKYHCRSLRDAYHLMCRTRLRVRPNIGFWRQLIAYEQSVKKTVGSVRLIYDEAQEERMIPDVYLRLIIAERPQNAVTQDNGNRVKDEGRTRRGSGTRPRFQPVLEPLPENLEAFA